MTDFIRGISRVGTGRQSLLRQLEGFRDESQIPEEKMVMSFWENVKNSGGTPIIEDDSKNEGYKIVTLLWQGNLESKEDVYVVWDHKRYWDIPITEKDHLEKVPGTNIYSQSFSLPSDMLVVYSFYKKPENIDIDALTAEVEKERFNEGTSWGDELENALNEFIKNSGDTRFVFNVGKLEERIISDRPESLLQLCRDVHEKMVKNGLDSQCEYSEYNGEHLWLSWVASLPNMLQKTRDYILEDRLVQKNDETITDEVVPISSAGSYSSIYKRLEIDSERLLHPESLKKTSHNSDSIIEEPEVKIDKYKPTLPTITEKNEDIEKKTIDHRP